MQLLSQKPKQNSISQNLNRVHPPSQLKVLFLVGFLICLSHFSIAQMKVEKWDMFEVSLRGPSDGNPFKEVELSATFAKGSERITCNGFYDGNGVYKVRFMPKSEGDWSYITVSNHKMLNNKKGEFSCIEPSGNNHGPVKVADTRHFSYEDGTPYLPFGTTCYAWTHQPQELQDQTVKTLAKAPFNKIRMCVFPKHYTFNQNDPDYYPFEGDSKENFNFAKFNMDYWKNLEKRIIQMQELGIEVDLILFHPYDYNKWDFNKLDIPTSEFYLKYLTARLSSFRNIWWSMANEFHIMQKSDEDWETLAKIVMDNDNYNHLISNHNHPRVEFDWSKPWVTHVSIQNPDMRYVAGLAEKYEKPIINDECEYEGNLNTPWGSISAEELINRYWIGIVNGVYTTHGETYMDENDVIWWAKGGILKGKSAKRIAFLKEILEDAPAQRPDKIKPKGWWDKIASGSFDDQILIYFADHQPVFWEFEFPEGNQYSIELIDPWEMKTTPIKGTFKGKCKIDLPAKPYLALRIKKI